VPFCSPTELAFSGFTGTWLFTDAAQAIWYEGRLKKVGGMIAINLGQKQSILFYFLVFAFSHTLLRRIKKSNVFDYRPNIKDIEY
jgi:hypothetical protein